MNVLLLRHGETALNASRVVQPAATPLNERGRVQAQAVATRLARLRPAALLASDLARARETAQAISLATGLPIDTSELLQERNFGDWRGRPYDALGLDPLDERLTPPGGESALQFAGRVGQAFAVILDRLARCEGDLVVVSHGLLIRTLLQNHLSLPAGQAVPERLENTSVTIVEGDSPFRVLRLNCVDHLTGADQGPAGGLSGF